MSNTHVSVLELDLNALKHNISYFKKKLNHNTKLLGVVKAYSYGHDAVYIAKSLESQGVDYLAVAYTDEGIILRKNGIKIPILVLHPQIPNFQKLISYNLEPNLYSKKTLTAFIGICKEKKLLGYPVHLKFNTGLNRLGFSLEEVNEILPLIKNTSIQITSLFSHLAASEDANENEFSRQQIEKFKQVSSQITKTLPYTPMLHMANTSGVINFPEAHFDMVRIGIGMYGFGNDEKETANLKNVGSLKTTISQIHTIKKGDSLGYNRAYTAKKDTKTATLPIGHADGICRNLGNGVGSVKINNKICPILGNVCMDMIMVDITTVDCKEGDQAIVFDNQQMLNELALKSDTISYELLTSISQRIRRIIVE
ncbi:alanine racemase [Flavicella sediminum]|uniref:alanine racemase n=1 Tax=Flavicella sediminum TaxID=2585141 RepID=UPI001120E1CE|nr:alanine racemase [Flavicella sediminum]